MLQKSVKVTKLVIILNHGPGASVQGAVLVRRWGRGDEVIADDPHDVRGHVGIQRQSFVRLLSHPLLVPMQEPAITQSVRVGNEGSKAGSIR